jgi:NAD(P)-dependent dehydrogenase (short-subunit alcohol dehydrogenase family)
MRVNVQGTLNCVRAQLNNIRTGSGGRGGGSIVNASSVAGIMGFTQNAAYAASKHAVIGISRCAAKEEGPRGIRINCVAP